MSRSAFATIHLDALRHNLGRIRALAPQSRVMAVVKADGYGHGLERVARTLSGADAYDVLCGYGKPSLAERINADYRGGFSQEGAAGARTSPLMALLTKPGGHYDVTLNAAERERLATWLDAYAQRLGSFSDQQEAELLAFRQRVAAMLEP